jgi:hypothetical protein
LIKKDFRQKNGGPYQPPWILEGNHQTFKKSAQYKILVSSLLSSDLNSCGASCHRDPQRVDHHPGVEETEQAYIL